MGIGFGEPFVTNILCDHLSQTILSMMSHQGQPKKVKSLSSPMGIEYFNLHGFNFLTL